MRHISYHYVSPGWWWVRVFGFGIFIRPSEGWVKPFSERYRRKKALYIFGRRIALLWP